MTERLSTSLLFSTGISNVLAVSAEASETQTQISTGRAILTPSDDPVGATQILALTQQLEINEQFQANIDVADSALELEDGVLGGINEALFRLRELTVTAGNGGLNANDRSAIAFEVREILEQVAGLLNTQNGAGEFIFGGFRGDAPPFQADASGSFEYVGDDGNRFLQVDTSITVPINDNGKDLFVEIPAESNTFVTSNNPTNQAIPPASITTGIVVDQEQFDSFFPEDFIITANGDSTVNITQRSDGRPIASNLDFEPGLPFSFAGIQVTISGTPNAGDSFFVTSTNQQGLLTTIERLAIGLETLEQTPTDLDVLQTLVGETLQNITNAETNILQTRASIGARLNTLDSISSLTSDIDVITQELLSEIQDLDFAEAVSDLAFENFVLEAAQTSFATITSLSLFDVI